MWAKASVRLLGVSHTLACAGARISLVGVRAVRRVALTWQVHRTG